MVSCYIQEELNPQPTSVETSDLTTTHLFC